MKNRWDAYQIPDPLECPECGRRACRCREERPVRICLACGDDALEDGDYCKFHQRQIDAEDRYPAWARAMDHRHGAGEW